MALPKTWWGILCQSWLPLCSHPSSCSTQATPACCVCSGRRLLLPDGFPVPWGNALLMDYKQQRLFALFKLKQSKWARDCKSAPSWLEAMLAIIQDKNKASILENAFSQFKNLVSMMDRCSVVSTFRYKALLCRWMYKSKIHKVTLLCVK